MRHRLRTDFAIFAHREIRQPSRQLGRDPADLPRGTAYDWQLSVLVHLDPKAIDRGAANEQVLRDLVSFLVTRRGHTRDAEGKMGSSGISG